MAQLQRMDACLDTLSTELYQVNVRFGRITRRQAAIGSFAPEPTPSPSHPVASDSDAEDDDDDDNDDDGDDNEDSDDDGDASSTDEIYLTLYSLSLVTKRGNSFGYESSHSQGESQFLGLLCQGECCYYFLRDVARILCIFSFLSFLDTLFLYMRSCDHLQTYIVLIFSYLLWMYVFLSLTLSCVVFFLSLYTYFLLICMQSIILFHTKMP